MQNKKHRRLFLETLESRIVLTGPAVNVSDLVSWYRAEGNAIDSQGGNNGMQVAGATTVTGGRVGKAFEFNSSSRRIEIQDNPSLDLQAFTIDAWVYSTFPGSHGDSTGGEIIGKALPNQGSGVSVSILGPGSDGRFTFAANLSNGDQQVFPSSTVLAPTPPFPPQWHHVAMTSDGANIYGYVDGVLQTAPGGAPHSIALVAPIRYDPATPWTIGGHPNTGPNADTGPYGDHFYEGLIDEVGFYRRGLSAAEVWALYNQPVNTTPIANNNAWSVDENQVLNVSAAGVLRNDVDSTGGNALTAALVAGPSHGNVTLHADGSFVYTPDANYSGPDSYTYKANDGTADSNVATVNITVVALAPTNNAPVAANDAYSTAEDAALMVAAPGILSNDTDADGDPLTSIRVSGPSHGTLTQNANGSFAYTPAANYNGPDSYTYKANDGTADSSTATVTIAVTAVNDAPVAADDAYSTSEDAALSVAAPGILFNDTDADSDPLTSILVSGPSHGTLTQNADGSFTYTPATNYNGPDSFTYTANDGTVDSNVATVNITVTAVNDAPVAVNDAYSTAEDAALTVAAPGILANDSDVEGSPLTSILVTGPSHGTLTQNVDGSFTYTPAANYNGPDSFTYTANDGTVDSNVATVNITVTAVNDAPVAVNDAYGTANNAVLTVAAPGILANDADVEGSPLTSILVTGPSHGTLALNANGSFTYTPAANYSGPDSYTYKANDGTSDSNTATVNITVTPFVQILPDPARPGMTMLVVGGTSGNDILALAPTANAGEYRVTLNGLILGVYSPTGSVQIYGNGGSDTFALNGNSLTNMFEVHSDCLILNTLPFFDHAVATRQVNALGSSDTITVYGGSATIDGGAASDTLVAAGAGSHDWQITAQNTGSLDGLVSFSAVEQLVGGAGADTFHLGMNAHITGSIDGGGGSDLFIAPDSANTWTVSSASGGTVKNTDFTGFEILRGGSDADKFRITPGITFAGTLDGGGGTDLLDYSAYTTAVTVNLGAGTATGAGGVSGFEDIAGGDGNDLLAGNAAANDISGGNGDDIILGMGGNDTLDGNAGMDFVAGGSGADTVHGNNGDDILVGGVLTYANENSFAINQAALNAIMAEWTRNLAYSMRIGHLTVNSSGGFNGGFMLNSSTVQDDFSVDTLFGDAGQDWFLAEINDVVKTTKGETVTDP